MLATVNMHIHLSLHEVSGCFCVSFVQRPFVECGRYFEASSIWNVWFNAAKTKNMITDASGKTCFPDIPLKVSFCFPLIHSLPRNVDFARFVVFAC
jgi:hypothetical protein